jgi:trehalose synthase
MSSLVIEHLDLPASARHVRAYEVAGERAGDMLAGRTVWCATALPRARRAAEQLREHIEGAAPDGAAATLHIQADERQLRAAEHVDRLLDGGDGRRAGPPREEPEPYAEAAAARAGLFEAGIGDGDVVVAHDAPSALLIEAVRERGAHAIWRVRLRGSASTSGARQALELVRRFTPRVDAYVITWRERSPRGEILESVAAAMPSAGILASKEFPSRSAGIEPRRLAWRMALAEILRSDRGECVGGTLQPRPTVAAR